jgi:hypothetical protein
MFSLGLMCLIYMQFNMVSAVQSLPIYLNKLIYLYTPTLQLSIKPRPHVKILCWCISWCKHKAYRLQVYCITQQPWVRVPLQTVAVSTLRSFCMCAAPHFASFQALDILSCRLVQFLFLIIFPTLCVKLSVLPKILNASYFAVSYAQNIDSAVNFQHLSYDRFLRYAVSMLRKTSFYFICGFLWYCQ